MEMKSTDSSLLLPMVCVVNVQAGSSYKVSVYRRGQWDGQCIICFKFVTETYRNIEDAWDREGEGERKGEMERNRMK